MLRCLFSDRLTILLRLLADSLNRSWLKYWVLALCLLPASGCSVQLKQASDPWDQPKPQAVLASKSWNSQTQAGQPPASKQAQAPIKVQPKSSQPHLPSHWQVEIPDLPGESPLETSPVLELAQRYLGTPYHYGGETPAEGFDCSGLVQYVFAQKGVALKRLANEQYLQGSPVKSAELKAGDLVFFSTSGKVVDHVGIYAGSRLFIHAPRTGRNVSYDSMDSSYFSSRYQGARRIQL